MQDDVPPAPLGHDPAAATPAAPVVEGTRLQKISWVLYDCGNSGYALVIAGPLFSPYFVGSLLPVQPSLPPQGNGEAAHGLVLMGATMPGDAVWALLTAASAVLVALAAPLLGAIADIRGWTKRLLAIHALAGCALTLCTIFLAPGRWQVGAVIYVLTNYCFGTSLTFYNAYLPRLARPERQGSLSGQGFAWGYLGGAAALVLCLGVYLWTDRMPLALALSGIWWLIFTIPALMYLKETPPMRLAGDRGPLVLAGFRRLGQTFRNVRHYRMLFLFLGAYLLYTNGTDTVINVSPAFAEQRFGMGPMPLVGVFLLVQVVAFVGAMSFGYLADRVGNKPVIVGTLVVWVLAVGAVIFTQNAVQFTLAAACVGIVLGGVQSSSRALMGQLAPEAIRNEAFGFFSLSGKAVSVVGPLVYAGLATKLGTRFGVLSVLPFLVAGLLLVLRVREPARAEKA